MDFLIINQNINSTNNNTNSTINHGFNISKNINFDTNENEIKPPIIKQKIINLQITINLLVNFNF